MTREWLYGTELQVPVEGRVIGDTKSISFCTMHDVHRAPNIALLTASYGVVSGFYVLHPKNASCASFCKIAWLMCGYKLVHVVGLKPLEWCACCEELASEERV